MPTRTFLAMALCIFLGSHSAWGQERWTLEKCIEYALENNIQMQMTRLAAEKGEATLREYQAALWPSVSVSTYQSMGYRPFQESMAIVQNSQVVNTSHKVTGQSSYGVSMNWTLYNGGVNQMNIKNQRLQNQMTDLQLQEKSLTIQEQIAQLYLQALYCMEVKRVNEKLAETAQKQLERGQELFNHGQVARAEVAQLEAQLANAKYDVVSAQTQVDEYKRQLKRILQLDIDTPFDIIGTAPTDEQVLSVIPSATAVYEQAVASRPEVESAELGIQVSRINLDIARAGYLPTIGLSASVGDSHYTANHAKVGTQMKDNLNGTLGVNISVPIWDQRRTRSQIERAKLEQLNSQLNLQETLVTLGSTIEEHWLNATNSQQQYISAKAQVNSQQASYELLNEQFNEGLKNVVDLLTGRDKLLQAQQGLLQSKYTALLNMQLLKFYQGLPMEF